MIRVTAARRLLTDSPKASEHVELVGQRHGHGRAVAVALQRHGIGRPLRLVVQLDGARDGRIHVLGLRVVAAHEALELGELADHARYQIGLGQLGGALRKRCFAQLLRGGDLPGELLDALGALELCAKLFMEGDALQFIAHDLQLLLEILLPEELGVGEPRGDHLLVAGDDGLAAVLGFQVGDQQEVVRQLLAVAQGEALLVRLHRRRQALGRHGEKRLVELTHEHGGPFGEAGVLGGELIVLDQPQVRVLGQRVRAFVDRRGARGGIQHHLVLLELLLVVGKARHLERLVAEEAMAARFLAGLDAGDLEGHHLAVEEQHDRMQRADPA